MREETPSDTQVASRGSFEWRARELERVFCSLKTAPSADRSEASIPYAKLIPGICRELATMRREGYDHLPSLNSRQINNKIERSSKILKSILGDKNFQSAVSVEMRIKITEVAYMEFPKFDRASERGAPTKLTEKYVADRMAIEYYRITGLIPTSGQYSPFVVFLHDIFEVLEIPQREHSADGHAKAAIRSQAKNWSK